MENPAPNGNSPETDGCIGCLFFYCILLTMLVGGMLFGWPIVLLVGVGIVGIILLWGIILIARALDWILQLLKFYLSR